MVANLKSFEITNHLFHSITSTCRLSSFQQHWSKLDTAGDLHPQARFGHAACCIVGPLTGPEHPLLLVEGGCDKGVLNDMWVLDIDGCAWNEVRKLKCMI